MLDTLNVYLQTSTTPELRGAITEAFEQFDAYGLEDADIGYEDILMTSDNEGTSEALMKIVVLTEELQDSILAQLQIKLVQEATISEGNTVLRSLKLLETTEFNDEIADVCRHNTDPVEALAEILNLVTGIDTERLVILFEEVSPSLISRIGERAQLHIGEHRDVADVGKNAVLMKRFLAYRTAMDNQQLFMYDMLIAGVPLDSPYAIYHEKIMQAIQAQELVQPMMPRLRQVKTAVQLCAAIVVACDTQDANMRNIVMAELEKTYTDLDTITPIYIEIDSIMTKFHALMNTGTLGANHEKA